MINDITIHPNNFTTEKEQLELVESIAFMFDSDEYEFKSIDSRFDILDL